MINGVANSGVIPFAFSFAKPKTVPDWRMFSAFSVFFIAQMYGF